MKERSQGANDSTGAAIRAAMLAADDQFDQEPVIDKAVLPQAIPIEDDSEENDPFTLAVTSEDSKIVPPEPEPEPEQKEEVLIYPPGVYPPGHEPKALDLDGDSAYVTFGYDDDVTEVLTNAVVVNVTSRSLGVVATSQKTNQPKTSVLIPKGSKLPAKHQRVYGTVRDNQDLVEVRIVEGESNNPRACTPIGKCVVSPLPTGLPRGSRISVTFEYDQSGRLYVQAKDEASGAEVQTTIGRQNAMSQEQLGQAKELVDALYVN